MQVSTRRLPARDTTGCSWRYASGSIRAAGAMSFRANPSPCCWRPRTTSPVAPWRNCIGRSCRGAFSAPSTRRPSPVPDSLKKLRYTAEFFRHSQRENDQVPGFLAGIARLQDALGHDNDAAMTAPLLSTLERDELARGVQRSIGVVMGWQARDRLAGARTLNKQWRRFKAAAPHWQGRSD